MKEELKSVFRIEDPATGETNDYEFVPLSEYCEIYWQAAIMYAQKYHRAMSNKEEDRANHFKTMALSTAMSVWCNIANFSEKEMHKHVEIFSDTILRNGGSSSSVADYFVKVADAGCMYPAERKERTLYPC